MDICGAVDGGGGSGAYLIKVGLSLKFFPTLPEPSGKVSKPKSLSYLSLKGSGCRNDRASKDVLLFFSSILRSLRLRLAALMGGLPFGGS